MAIRVHVADIGQQQEPTVKYYDLTQWILLTFLPGPPECYQWNHFTDETLTIPHITPAVDIWALGCILSEAATWVLEGHQGLENYRLNRAKAHRDNPKFEDSDCFHDGCDVLDFVGKHHDYLRYPGRDLDEATIVMLDIVDSQMLRARPEDRLEAHRLLSRAHNQLLATDPQSLHSPRGVERASSVSQTQLPSIPIRSNTIPPQQQPRSLRKQPVLRDLSSSSANIWPKAGSLPATLSRKTHQSTVHTSRQPPHENGSLGSPVTTFNDDPFVVDTPLGCRTNGVSIPVSDTMHSSPPTHPSACNASARHSDNQVHPDYFGLGFLGPDLRSFSPGEQTSVVLESISKQSPMSAMPIDHARETNSYGPPPTNSPSHMLSNGNDEVDSVRFDTPHRPNPKPHLPPPRWELADAYAWRNRHDAIPRQYEHFMEELKDRDYV